MSNIKINNNLSVDRSIFDFLSNTSDIICNLILNIRTLEGINYISPSDKEDAITCLPQSKYVNSISFDPYSDGVGRMTMRVGRIVTKLIPEDYISHHKINDKSIEDFVNKYKSWFGKSDLDIKVVEGEEIRKWYLDDNYFAPGGRYIGSLWNSCMRQKDRQKYLNMYCVNKDIKMLVLTTKVDNKEKVRARALLWNNVESIDSNCVVPSNIKVMDRIYSVFDSDVHTFKVWAEQNGYITKWEQNSKTHQYFDVKGNAQKIKCSIKLENYNLDHYPYLDTFPFFNKTNGKLFNDEYEMNYEYILVQSNGDLRRQEPEPEYHEDDYFIEEYDYDQ